MANDFISRDYTVENMENYPWDTEHDKNAAIHLVRELVPAADVVEVKHGKWNYNPDGMDWGLCAWECSLCGCTNHNLPMEESIKPLMWAGSKYCPNCGAKMDGERKEEKK